MKTARVTSLVMMCVIMAIVALVVLAGCARNRPSEKPPIHFNQNMDDQPRFKQQTYSAFYDNHSAMRMPVEGTVARGSLREDSVFYTGYDGKGRLVKTNPLPMTMDLLRRGEERFNIYCSSCHGRTGDGQGAVVIRGLIAPPSFHEQRLVDTGDGHIFEVITNGLRNMPTYKYQIPVEDRWAIVAYFRALQRSQRAHIEDIPADMRQDLH